MINTVLHIPYGRHSKHFWTFNIRVHCNHHYFQFNYERNCSIDGHLPDISVHQLVCRCDMIDP